MIRSRPGLSPLAASVLACLGASLASLPGLWAPITALHAAPLPPEVVVTPHDDGRVATVVDRQGTALVRPVGRQRWTPLAQRSLLMPGDLVRTPARGAHALEIAFAAGGTAVLGPGTTVELTAASAVRIYTGEMEVKGAAGKPAIAVQGPGDFKQDVRETLVLRVADRKTAVLQAPPRWLTGYRASTTDEWVGSLVAKVDGRDVPLSVGYHKVDAVIRDQIAQTTVEQSFINSTKNRLEGVFYFPLPADASISGFGMWIGNELVEADIVEKQRAREIYEDILRRKKDPGLLEWSGGNLFKARVFPIEPHSEKRIRIRYTQVLPVEGSTVRYRYALRSELLRKRPLRELSIKLSVASAAKIDALASSTHEVRVRATGHAATLEYDAQEVTPERDFEAVLTLARGAPPLTVVPHRRVDDGYFMMLLAPPDGASGAWQRDLMPEGAPVDLLVVADTSASMDVAAREGQAAFVRSLLALLGEKDRFRLLTADVEVQRFAAEPVAVSEKSVESAMTFLAQRDSLGWTDLDRVLAQLAADCTPSTVAVYVGDGIGTTGDADPVALAARIRKAAAGCRGVVHAVSTAATYERGVLEALARIGGGSVRSAGEDPAAVAYGLLSEAAQPAVKDLKVEFEGVRTARVYPGELPNLPVGSQQIVLGRFLPTGQDQKGTAIVRGTLQGKPVRYTAPFVLEAAETGNSFIPRLWARRHLDALLAQGRTPEVKADIVAFSEEFGIMTPYTSFLVLENDEDRKRYGVERRVAMRDGEQFFAEGRDAATTEILRQQMRQARTWRLQLRLAMLREIEGLGRELQGWSVGYGAPETKSGVVDELARGRVTWSATRDAGDGYAMDHRAAPEESAAEAPTGAPAPALDPAASPEEELNELQDLELRSAAKKENADRMAFDDDAGRLAKRRAGFVGGGGGRGGRFRSPSARRPPARPPAPAGLDLFGFPGLAAPRADTAPVSAPAWPKDVLDLVAALDRRPRLAEAKTAFALSRVTYDLHPVQGRIDGWSADHGLFRAGAWSVRRTGRGAQPVTSYLLDGERGVMAESLGLGRRRAGAAGDERFAFPLADYSTVDLPRLYRDWAATLAGDTLTLRAPRPGRARLELTIDRARRVVTRVRSFDGDRLHGTTVFSEFVDAGGMSWATRIEQQDDEGRTLVRRELTVSAITAGECTRRLNELLARRSGIVFAGHEDPKVADCKQALHEGKAGVIDHLRMVTHFYTSQQWDKAWAAWQQAEALMTGKAAAPLARLVLLQASRRGEEFRTAVGELTRPWPKLVERSAQAPEGQDFLVARVYGAATSALAPAELLTLHDSLEPVYRRAVERGPKAGASDARARDLQYRRIRAGLLDGLGRHVEALELVTQTAATHPESYLALQDYLGALGRAGDLRRQVTSIASRIGEPKLWLETEVRALYDAEVDALYALRDLEALERVAAKWTERQPKEQGGWHCSLAAQMFRNKADAVTAWVQERLRAADPREDKQLAELRAAVQFALGQGWNMRSNHVADRWETPLAAVVRRCTRAGGAQALQVTDAILGSWYFRRTDAWRQLCKDLLADLLGAGGIPALSLEQLAVYMRWIQWGRNAIDRADWEKVRGGLRARFDAADAADAQRVLAGYVLQVLDAHGEKEAALAFLRDWSKVAKDRPDTVVRQLFDRLLQLDWTAAVEDEAFALIARLLPAGAEPTERETQGANGIRHLAAQLVERRVAATLGPVAELEKVSRQERNDRTKRAREQARKDLAARFARAADADDSMLRRWFRIEQLAFQAEGGGDRKAEVAAALELLRSVPGTGSDDEPGIHRVLRARCAVTMAYSATRRDADPSVGDAVLKVYREEAAARPATLEWRDQICRLLVALDRTDALIAELGSWIDKGKADTTWRRTLAYLRAERGELPQAVEVFEGVESADELGESDYAALADWHLVLGDDARRQTALRRRFAVTPEYGLSNRLGQLRNKVSQRGGGLPGTVTPEDLLALEALLHKATRPDNYVWQVSQVYRQCKDFRVLGSLPYGVVGHTVGSTYLYLQRVGQVIAEVHEEATCDTLAAAITAGLGKHEVPTERRGLRLLSALVSRRAAKVRNAPGDHVRAALAAMQAAFKEEWQPGERVQMAGFLASLGRIEHQSLADEQLRQLRALHAAVQAEDRVHVARSLAATQWSYGSRDAAIDTLTAALDELRTRSGGHLPAAGNSHVQMLVGYLRQCRHFRRGEAFLLAERGRQAHQAQKSWYDGQLRALYIECLQKGGEVSLGRGAALFAALRERMLATMWESPWDVLAPTFDAFCSLHETAHKAGIGAAAGAFDEFAQRTMTELAPRLLLDMGGKHNRVAHTLKSLSGPARGLRHLVDALEREPAWLRTVNREYWRNQHHTLASLRREARGGDARLRKIVLRELRFDLEAGAWRGTSIFYKGNRDFWFAAAADYVRTTVQFVADRKDSFAAVNFAASYLWSGLGARDEAIASLRGLLDRGALPEGGRWQLARWYEETRQYDEARPLLLALSEERPDRLDYRMLLARVHHHLGDTAAAVALLEGTCKRLKEKEQWSEGTMGSLAFAAFECRQWQLAAGWYEEAVRANERGGRRHWNWRRTRSGYYGQLARAYGELGQSDKAVDAASAAVVTWGSDQDNRRNALSALHSVIAGIPDLDAYAKRWDGKVAETGLDAPLIRKHLGKVYLERGAARRAIAQLTVARELQPVDDEVHEFLLQAYDRLDDAAGAIAALKASIRMAPMNLDLYSGLAHRAQKSGDAATVERAYTSMVEVKPDEAESHRRLAEVRANQKRFEDAVVQWRQVVRIRSLEPDGWFGLARAQIDARQLDGAEQTLKSVLDQTWESRFGKVHAKARDLLAELRSKGS